MRLALWIAALLMLGAALPVLAAVSSGRDCGAARAYRNGIATWLGVGSPCRNAEPALVQVKAGAVERAGASAVGDISPPQAIRTPPTGPEPAIPSEFPIASQIEPAWRDGVAGAAPPSAAPDVVGAFRFVCTPSHLSYDDPVVYPGQPGASHLHQWFGNTEAGAHSTYESLRRTGRSTCMNPLNRSAYWMPAMLDGSGHVVRPDYVTVYYKRRPASDPECRRLAAKGCAPIPRGLRYVFGYDMVTHKPANGGVYFDCDGPGAVRGRFNTIAEAAKGCPSSARLGAVINAPECWDGKRLDSANHRDHMASPGYGDWGYQKCPSSHPYAIPAFTMGAWFTVGAGGADAWYLSSDEMPGKPRMPGGSTFHADWFGAWDDATMATWTAHCIDRMLNCSGGNLGNGTQLRQTGPFAWNAEPRLAPIPKRPASGSSPHGHAVSGH
jgi:hypothetical protein